MKKSNINLLLVALSSAAVLAACNSGSSPSPSPTPTPGPTPTPTPGPTPTPTPGPTPNESGVAALVGGYQFNFSVAPSTESWTNYNSGTSTAISALVTSSGPDVALIGDSTSNPTNQILVGSASDGQFVPVTLGSGFGTVNNKLVAAAESSAVILNDAGTYASVISATGAVTTNVVTVAGSASPVVANSISYANGQYIAVTSSSIYVSTNGYNWTLVGTTNLTYTNIAYVNGVYVAMTGTVGGTYGSQATGKVYVATTLAGLAGYTANNSVASNVNNFVVSGTSLYIASDNATNVVVQQYTPYATGSSTGASLGSQVGSTILSGFTTTQTVTSLATLNGSVYAAGKNGATTDAVYLAGSAATAVASNTTANGVIVANNTGSLLIANNNDGLTSTAAASVAGNLQNYSAGTWTDLPSGNSHSIVGFVGSTTNYMAVASNGGTIVSSESGFVPAATLVSSTGTNVTVQNTASNGSQFVVTGLNTGSALAEIYTSANNGSNWTAIKASAISSTVAAANLVLVSYASGQYYFDFYSGGATYLATFVTATPQTASSYVQVQNVTNVPGYNSNVYSIAGQTVKFVNASTAVYVYANNAFALSPIELPANYVQATTSSGNIAASTTTAALAQASSRYVWTATSLAGSFTMNTATFAANVEGTATPTAFTSTPQLFWTGKTWVSEVTASTGNYVYSSTAGTSWSPAVVTTAGTSSQATVPAGGLFLF